MDKTNNLGKINTNKSWFLLEYIYGQVTRDWVYGSSEGQFPRSIVPEVHNPVQNQQLRLESDMHCWPNKTKTSAKYLEGLKAYKLI